MTGHRARYGTAVRWSAVDQRQRRKEALQYVDEVAALARRKGIVFLALVSVYGTHVMWARHGFRVAPGDRLGARLDGYGDTARYMVRNL